ADTTNCVLPVGYMDSWNGCSSLATHATVCLADPRDYRTYRVRKLADGNCWMVDSLKFGGNYGDTDGCSANSGVGNFGSGGSSNSTKAQETFATGYYGHCRSIPGTYSDDYYNDTRAYNNYLYDWVAAMQSTLAYVGSTTTFTSPQQGICPSGWHLPEADIVSSSGEYYSLLIAYCGSTVNCQTSDLQGTTKGNFTLAGAANGSTGNLESQGEYGGFWSSSADPDWYGIAYGFWAQSDYVGADWDPLKSTGGSVRCIKD
ncbi:hypothetical protein IJI99_00375, partial [bacterium]|nr:hypothetical protein [bacterium]